MKPFAARSGRVKESGTVRVANAVAELRKQGRDILSFSVGEPDFDTPVAVRDAAKRALDNGETHYVPSWGIPELREAIAAKHKRDNALPVEAKNVLVAPAKQAIFYTIMSIVDHGDEVLLPDPAWVTYEPLVRLAGGKPVPVPTRAEDGWRMTPEALAAAAAAPKAKMLIVNSPSNPTGGVQSRADMKAFADLARDRDLWVLSDELYEKILYEGEHVSIGSLPGMFERTVTVNGLSKSHAMTGWRMGWIAADLPILKECNKLQQQSLTHPASFSQRASVTALTMDDAPIKAMVAEFRARRDLMVKGLRQVEGFHLPVTPPGAFYVFPKYDFAMDSLAFAEHLLHKGGLATTPGVEFGAGGEHHLRLSYATSREKIQEGLKRLEDAVQGLPKRK